MENHERMVQVKKQMRRNRMLLAKQQSVTKKEARSNGAPPPPQQVKWQVQQHRVNQLRKSSPEGVFMSRRNEKDGAPRDGAPRERRLSNPPPARNPLPGMVATSSFRTSHAHQGSSSANESGTMDLSVSLENIHQASLLCQIRCEIITASLGSLMKQASETILSGVHRVASKAIDKEDTAARRALQNLLVPPVQ